MDRPRGAARRPPRPPGTDGTRWVAALADLAPSIQSLMALVKPDATGGGSNNWVGSGDLTDTGEPILIGDPHRELEMPAMYAPAHAAGARFDSVGLTVPGGPGFPHAGHNAQVAWCVTHAMADIQDHFIERFKDGGRRSLHKGAWRETEIHEETIRVRSQDSPERVTIHRTCHGPAICGDPAGGGAITLASPQLSGGEHSFDCLPRMLRAGAATELYEATRGWSLIDDNLMAAERDGHIDHRVRARCGKRFGRCFETRGLWGAGRSARTV